MHPVLCHAVVAHMKYLLVCVACPREERLVLRTYHIQAAGAAQTHLHRCPWCTGIVLLQINAAHDVRKRTYKDWRTIQRLWAMYLHVRAALA